MPAYAIFIREGEIVDPEAMAAYQSGNRSGAPADMKPLVVYGAMEALEGEAPHGVVILQFPDMVSAREWYHGDYFERAKLRQKAASYRAFLVEGL
jgi:uncharacterized protein (DUF1330 family)